MDFWLLSTDMRNIDKSQRIRLWERNRLKSLDITKLHLHDILEKEKLQGQKRNYWSPEVGGGYWG